MNVDSLTVKELKEMGARVDVIFHGNKELQEAREKMKPFAEIGGVESRSRDGAYWLEIRNKKKQIEVTAFYEKNSRSPQATKEKNLSI